MLRRGSLREHGDGVTAAGEIARQPFGGGFRTSEYRPVIRGENGDPRTAHDATCRATAQ
jgi:hypothetical protein